MGAVLTASVIARAGDLPMPVKAPPPAPLPDWTGFHVGAHFGVAWGSSNWSASDLPGGTPTNAGSFGVYQPYNFSGGTGSYFSGLQAGYDRMLTPRLLIGAEADVTFPNSIGGAQTLASASIGQARYEEMVQMSGTVRGRVGQVQGHWLLYATGGLAWTYDRFTRTQLAGVPVNGSAVPGTAESLFMVPRAGWAAGAGVEFALPSHWSARIEYLATGFGNRPVTFPAGAQRFDSDLLVQSIRLGLNYRIGERAWSDVFAKGLPALEMDNFAFHAQTTYLSQYAFPVSLALSRSRTASCPTRDAKPGT